MKLKDQKPKIWSEQSGHHNFKSRQHESSLKTELTFIYDIELNFEREKMALEVVNSDV